jgi:hypothetical protein
LTQIPSLSTSFSTHPWPIIFPAHERPSFIPTSEKRQFAY